MNKWQRRGLVWGLPAVAIGLVVALALTNGSLHDFFKPLAWGSLLYANSWDHLIHGNLFIDPGYANGEYFLVQGGHVVTYFGVMPIIVRAFGGLLVHNLYALSLTNLSMVVATLLALGSVWYAVRRLGSHSRHTYTLGLSIVLMLLLGSPMSYLLVWSWTYHEVILWGLAWALLFTSLYALWIFDRQRITKWHTTLMGLAVGMAVLSRPTISLTLIVPFAFICIHAGLAAFRTGQRHNLKLLMPGIIICGALGIAAMWINYQRWGSPFTFVRIDQNVQFVELYPQRREDIKKSGEFNIVRLPFSLYYYLVPSLGNVSTNFPFITLDRELTIMNHAPHYDYIEGSRVPITLSMTYLVALAILGAFSLRVFKRAERHGIYWFLGGAALTFGTLVTVYAVALRYSAECIPAVVFLALTYLVALRQGAMPRLGGKSKLLLLTMAAISLYCTFITAVAYKQFVWDVPSPVRFALQKFIHYSPAPGETKHIIDGKRFSIY